MRLARSLPTACPSPIFVRAARGFRAAEGASHACCLPPGGLPQSPAHAAASAVDLPSLPCEAREHLAVAVLPAAPQLPLPGSAALITCTPAHTASDRPCTIRLGALPHAPPRSDPLRYIRSVQGQFAHVGIALIQPPPSWKPPQDPLAELRLRQVTRGVEPEALAEAGGPAQPASAWGLGLGQGMGGAWADRGKEEGDEAEAARAHGAAAAPGADFAGGEDGDAAKARAAGSAAPQRSPARASTAAGAGGPASSSLEARLRARSRQIHNTMLAQLPPTKKALTARLQTVGKRKPVAVPAAHAAAAARGEDEGEDEGAGGRGGRGAAPPTLLSPYSLSITPAYHLKHSLGPLRA